MAPRYLAGSRHSIRGQRRGKRMRASFVSGRLRLAGLALLGIAALVTVLGGSSVAKSQAAYNEPLCVQHPQLCTEQLDPWTYEGESYNAGHDEPSLLFYSHKPGSGNSNQYRLT